MKITKKVLKEMIEEILAEDIDVSDLLTPDMKNKLEKAAQVVKQKVSPQLQSMGTTVLNTLENGAKAVGLPSGATAAQVVDAVADQAAATGRDATKVIQKLFNKAKAGEVPTTSADMFKFISSVPTIHISHNIIQKKVQANLKTTKAAANAVAAKPVTSIEDYKKQISELKAELKKCREKTEGKADKGCAKAVMPAAKKIKDKAKKVARKKIRKRKCPKLPLRIGCQGPLVKEVQKLLIDLGYNLGRTADDGDFGRATRRAVKKFQRAEGIGVDGVVGDITYGRLKGGPQPAVFGGPSEPEKAKKATAAKKATGAKKDDRLDTPLVGEVPEMSRVEALRRVREDLVPLRWVKRYRRPSDVRFLALKAIKYLMDELGVEPGRAYYDLEGVFGLGGARYFEPRYRNNISRYTGAPRTKVAAQAGKFVRNLENVLGIELEELEKLNF